LKKKKKKKKFCLALIPTQVVMIEMVFKHCPDSILEFLELSSGMKAESPNHLAFHLFGIHSCATKLVFLWFHRKVLELEIKHKHGGFNINYENATVVWQQFGFGL
jgi:hypothetical protein